MQPDEIRIHERRDRAEAEVNSVRGNFLAAMIDLESHLDRAIVYYFAPDEWHLFINLFLERMSLTQKVQALRKMLQHVGIHDKHQAIVKEVASLTADRNRFAHEGFDLIDNSYLRDKDFELYRKERLDPGPLVEDIVRLSDLQALVDRARRAEGATLEVAKDLNATHDPPTEYFQRSGWDPRHLFGRRADTPEVAGMLDDQE